jgi:predicted lipid-binding transport protein (Tim44 family)
MKTTNCLILSAAALLAGGLTTACQTRTEPASNATNQTTVSVATNSNQPATTPETKASPPTADKTETDQTSVGSLATPTEAYKTAYAVRQKKDLAGLKRVLSKKMIGFFTEIGEAEHKSLDDELKQLMDAPQASTAEARNEKIDGDTATLEYLDEKGEWKTMDFVKEGGGWKLTFPPAGKPR